MIIDICGKRISEYIVDILAKFNRGINDLKIRAIGGIYQKELKSRISSLRIRNLM
jgi:DNA-binding protein